VHRAFNEGSAASSVNPIRDSNKVRLDFHRFLLHSFFRRVVSLPRFHVLMIRACVLNRDDCEHLSEWPFATPIFYAAPKGNYGDSKWTTQPDVLEKEEANDVKAQRGVAKAKVFGTYLVLLDCL
jgi:hypothetical protein